MPTSSDVLDAYHLMYHEFNRRMSCNMAYSIFLCSILHSLWEYNKISILTQQHIKNQIDTHILANRDNSGDYSDTMMDCVRDGTKKSYTEYIKLTNEYRKKFIEDKIQYYLTQ